MPFPPHVLSSVFRRLPSVLPVLVFGFLWFTLINHLRVEWTVNPQYAYGWAVPFLCAFLLARKMQEAWSGERGAET
jgi:hypothetical protein